MQMKIKWFMYTTVFYEITQDSTFSLHLMVNVSNMYVLQENIWTNIYFDKFLYTYLLHAIRAKSFS